MQAYITMLPRLQAEEALRGVAVAQAGDGMIDADARRGIIERLEEQTGVEREPQSLQDLGAAMGSMFALAGQ